jgi:hypothetical protein
MVGTTTNKEFKIKKVEDDANNDRGLVISADGENITFNNK